MCRCSALTHSSLAMNAICSCALLRTKRCVQPEHLLDNQRQVPGSPHCCAVPVLSCSHSPTAMHCVRLVAKCANKKQRKLDQQMKHVP